MDGGRRRAQTGKVLRIKATKNVGYKNENDA